MNEPLETGISKDEAAYRRYVAYCESVGVKPAAAPLRSNQERSAL